MIKPYISENIYLDLNIDNLIMFYERSLKELDDFNKLFNINDHNREAVLIDPECDYDKKDPVRQVFEEICYVS